MSKSNSPVVVPLGTDVVDIGEADPLLYNFIANKEIFRSLNF